MADDLLLFSLFLLAVVGVVGSDATVASGTLLSSLWLSDSALEMAATANNASGAFVAILGSRPFFDALRAVDAKKYGKIVCVMLSMNMLRYVFAYGESVSDVKIKK